MLGTTRPDTPDPLRIVLWVCVTWITSAISAVLSIWSHDWDCVFIACNAVVCSAGWALSASRWAEWQASALSAHKELEILTRRRRNGAA